MLSCSILSPERTQRFDALIRITLPAHSGEIQILRGHAESFIALREGKIVLESGRGKEVVVVPGGECHVLEDMVNIIL